MRVNQKHIDKKGYQSNARCKSECFLKHCIFAYVSFFCFLKTTVMLFYKEIDYNEISAIKKLSPFHIHPSLTRYFLALKKLSFKHNNVLLVLVTNSCFTTSYPQPSEHHERVFHKNNNRKSHLYFIKSYVNSYGKITLLKINSFITRVGFKTSSFQNYFKIIQEEYDAMVSRKFDTAGIVIK